jgi:hypothetical protein
MSAQQGYIGYLAGVYLRLLQVYLWVALRIESLVVECVLVLKPNVKLFGNILCPSSEAAPLSRVQCHTQVLIISASGMTHIVHLSSYWLAAPISFARLAIRLTVAMALELP